MSYIDEKRKKLAHSLGVPETKRTPLELDKPKSKIIQTYLLMIFGAFLIIFNLCFNIVRVSGPSMLPTLHNNQFMLLSKHDKLDRFDIVVLNERLTQGGENKKIVKRLIAFGGERVTVVGGELYINNVNYKESYLDEENIQQFKQIDFDITVPEGHVFVLGDNRDVSKDSRMVGSFKKESVLGVKLL